MHLRHVRGIVIVILCAVVRGYHVNKDIWTSAHGEELQYQRETGNVHDLYAVSVMRSRPAAPALLHDLLIRTSELAVDEDGIESDGVSFKTDSTCWFALSSTRALRYFSSAISYFTYLEIQNYIFKITPKIQNFRN